jgi:hypothetical protein
MSKTQVGAEQRAEIDVGPAGGSAPGKQTLTSRLGRRAPSADAVAASMISQLGLVQRSGDGPVAGDPDALVARAAGGPSNALPAPLRQQFERSLGADLSNVRVHTDQSAAEAASGLGARAFAHGQDIYVGAGQYQPETQEGTFLLAHEVAHTVQQGGGARLQNRLEVGAVTDPLEADADRAAAAMVAGLPATVQSTAGGTIRRDPLADQMVDNADDAERARGEQMAGIENVSTVSDIEQARAKRNVIARTLPVLQRAGLDAELTQNNQTIGALDNYMRAAGTQESSLGQFQDRARALDGDFTRLLAQIETLDAARPGDIRGARDGAQTGDRIIEAANQGRGAQDMNQRYEAAVRSNSGSGALATSTGNAAQSRRGLREDADALSQAQGALAPAEAEVRMAVDNLVERTARREGDEAQGQIEGLEAQAEAAKTAIETIADVISTTVSAANATQWHEAAGDVIGTVANLAGHAASLAFDRAIRQLQSRLTGAQAREANAELTRMVTAVAAAKARYIRAGQAYINAARGMREQQTSHRETMHNMGDDADAATGGQGEFTQVAQILGECDAYLENSRATQQIGQNEQNAAGEAVGHSEEINNDGQGLLYYSPHQSMQHGRTETTTYRERVRLIYGRSALGIGGPHSAQGEGGANAQVDQLLAVLAQRHQQIEACAARLRGVFRRSGSGPERQRR